MRSADDVSASSSAQAFLSRAEINGPPRWCGVCFNGSQRQRTTQPHDFGDCRANDRSYDRGRPTYVNSARMPTDPEYREASSLRRSQCGWSRRSFFVAGCACVFGASMVIKYARAQQFVYPVPPPPPPIFNPSSPNTVPSTRGTPASPNARQAPFRGNLRPIGQDLRQTIVSTDENDSASKPGVDTDKDGGDADKAGHEKRVDSIGEMYAALRTCWMPPPKGSARHGMEYTVRFALRGESGVLMRGCDVYRDAVNAALGRCTPLHFSDRIGRAVAGRAIALRFVDNRTIDDGKSVQSPQQ